VFSALTDQGIIQPNPSAIRTIARTRSGDIPVSVGLWQGRPVVEMNQRLPIFHDPSLKRDEIAIAFGIRVVDLHFNFPIEVVSTGLNHLIVPIVDVDMLTRLRADYTALANLSVRLRIG
jgi:trans-2,3-dihydro-3-hydroxyanthranilate isomerase